MDSISNDNNMSSVLYLNNLINAISNCKKFYLSSSDIDSIIDCFGINIVARIDMQYQSSDFIFYASIRNNNDYF